MVRFDSAHSALLYGLDIQKRIKKLNDTRPKPNQLEFRVGISAGDIFIQEDQIYGDEVNISERVQRLAGAGKVCISENVYQLLKEYRQSFAFEYLGDFRLKLDEKPLKAYRVSKSSDSSIMLATDRQEPAQLSASHYTNSIAILPFRSVGEAPIYGMLGDGFAVDLITGLSCFREFYVIARNSSFIFRKNEPAMWDIARSLGVRYILEGSIREMGNRLRVNVQLWDLDNHRNIWGENYDSDLTLKHIFDVQDEITKQIIESTSVKLRQINMEKLRSYEPDSLNAYMHLLHGEQIHLGYTKATNNRARQRYETAISDTKQPSASTVITQGP